MNDIKYDFKAAKCMLCGRSGLTFVNKLRDDNSHWAAQCDYCGHIQLTPLPTVEEEIEYYQTNELYSVSKMTEEDLVRKLQQLIDFQYKILSELVQPPAKIMEIGSGYGLFLEKALKEGYDVAGFELSDDKRDYCERKSGIRTSSVNLAFDDVPKEHLGKYDAVAMFFLFEHIANPTEFLVRISKLLKANGKIIILVPNVNGYIKKYCSEYGDFHYLRPHLSYFSSDILKKMLSQVGFGEVNVSGKQQYSIENAIHWARNKAPFLACGQIDMPEGLEFVNEFYKSKVESEMKSDMLVATGVWKQK